MRVEKYVIVVTTQAGYNIGIQVLRKKTFHTKDAKFIHAKFAKN